MCLLSSHNLTPTKSSKCLLCLSLFYFIDMIELLLPCGFRHALNKFYVQHGVLSFNRFGFITPNEWRTFQQLHTTPEVMVCNNRMKELIQMNKFKHRLGPGGYKTAIPLETKKEQELREAGIPDPLEGCMLRTRNWIWVGLI
jgi:hypothetical protein